MIKRLVSQRQVVKNGSKVESARFAELVNSLEVITQNQSKGKSKNCNLNPRSCLSSFNSCPCRVRVLCNSATEL